jgi:hypothetical protein
VTPARVGAFGRADVRGRRVLAVTVTAVTVTVATIALLAGCARAVHAAADPPSAAAADPAAARAFPGFATALSPASAPGSSAGEPDPVGQLRRSLLGPRDLGPGWTGGDPPVPDAAAPAPCGGPGTVARFPDALRVGSTVDGPAAGFVVQEALSVYGDADTAREAFHVSAAGLDCGRGTLHGAPVTIAPAQDVRADVGGDQASSWRAGSDAVDAVLVVVQARQAVFTFAFVAPAGTAPTARPDPVALSRAAVARALAA